MKYVFTFNEINYGRIEVEADHLPDNGEIIEKILGGEADYSDTDFTEFRLVEVDGVANNKISIGTDSPDSFNVTITETLQKVVTVDANNHDEAEQMISDNWRAGDYILDSEHFMGVEFNAVPTAA